MKSQLLDSKGQVFRRLSVADIVALHVSVVRKMGISAGLIHEPMDYYFTYLEVETKQDHYYFMNNAVMLALNAVKLTAQYQIIDELNLLEKLNQPTSDRELVAQINEIGFETLASDTAFLEHVKNPVLGV